MVWGSCHGGRCWKYVIPFDWISQSDDMSLHPCACFEVEAAQREDKIKQTPSPRHWNIARHAETHQRRSGSSWCQPRMQSPTEWRLFRFAISSLKKKKLQWEQSKINTIIESCDCLNETSPIAWIESGNDLLQSSQQRCFGIRSSHERQVSQTGASVQAFTRCRSASSSHHVRPINLR